MFVINRFELDDRTQDYLRSLIVPFGFNGFGELVYYRTYSRIKPDGGQEDWADTVIRVTNGTFSIRKDFYIKNYIPWDDAKWQEYARGFALYMHQMKWMPPGRGLWAMGSDFVYERGAMALYNCAFTNLGTNADFADDIGWLMDSLMHGVGVGFGPLRDDLSFQKPATGNFDFIIPDTREGWVASVIHILNAYISGKKLPRLIYDRVRPAGMLIKGFGGVSSGPEPLKELHTQLVVQSNLFLEGKLDVVEYKTNVANIVGCCVVAGNVRRSAELCTGAVWDETFLNLKDYKINPHRAAYGWMSNNSVMLDTEADFDQLGEVAKRVLLNGEPGVINRRNLKYGRIGKNGSPIDYAVGFNPCITGETKLLTADGRGYVAIQDLLNTDLDVFCIDDQDEMYVRRMRNVRVTGEQVDVYRVTFDDGNFVDVTGNHKFMLRDRSFQEASQLVYGDQLAKVSRYIPDQRSDSRADQYIGFSYGGKYGFEHRLIAKAKFNWIDESEHVHHVDENRLNNSPTNLEVKDAVEHLSNHSVAEENGNYSGWSNQDLLNFGINLARKLGRRFSSKEWQEAAPIKSFSTWRKTEFGSVTEFAWLCADIADVLNERIDPRTMRHYQQMVKFGYDCEIRDGQVYVTKICEGCNQEFEIESRLREHACCSLTCNNKIRDYAVNVEGFRKAIAARHEGLREQQLDVYTRLKLVLQRYPKKAEWIQACKDGGVSFEISRKSSPFQSWGDLADRASRHNYRVLNVQYLGKRDVYNGTVDEFHNFIIGGFEDQTPHGRKVEKGIVNQQCGEIPLEHREVCNVDETLPTVCKSTDEWYKACEYATFYCSTVSLLPTHQSSTNRVVARNRRIGVGIIDYTGWIHAEGVHKVTRYLRNGYNVVSEANKLFNAEAGIPEAIRKTTVKPGGTVPKLAGKTPGAGYPTFNHTLRRIRIQQDTPFHAMLVEAGIPYRKDVVSANTDVFEYPILQGPAPAAEDVSVWQQAMNIILLQREWADNAVSNTIYFRPKWKLIEHSVAWSYESKNPCVLAEDYIGLNALREMIKTKRTEYVVDNQHKIVLIYGNDSLVAESKVYEYDPRHEEDVIEAVISSAIPHTKSLSLLPHTPKGVYQQMPEEGISEEEYDERLTKINNIDWSELRGSDGIDEKYCSGPTCEIPTI